MKLAIVGRPNVGKSSLFNALLGYARAIVLDEPGTTVDELCEKLPNALSEVFLLDTQGIFSERDGPLLRNILQKVDGCLFLADAGVGPTPFDAWISTEIRQRRLSTLLCINKIDVAEPFLSPDFSELGFETTELSVVHRRGLDEVRSWIASELKRRSVCTDPVPAALSKAIRLAIVGRPNSGKSTLMNFLCQGKISQVGTRPLTTRDPVTWEVATSGERFKLFDTAGMRRPRSRKAEVESLSIRATLKAIKRADVVFLMIRAHEPISDQDMRLVNLVIREGKPVAVLLNFWDKLSPKQQKHFGEDSELWPYLKPFHTLSLSATTGFHSEQCLPLAEKLYVKARRRLKTSTMNEIVQRLIKRNPPPTVGRHPINILYASQVRSRPPTIVFFMNRSHALPLTYQKYLQNQLRRELGLKSQALRLYFREARG